MKTVELNGTWSVRAEPLNCIGDTGLEQVCRAKDDWMDAQVPGEIHLDLVRAGKMPEPTVGTNMPECRWPETKSWWYRTAFEVDEAFLCNEQQELVFDGVDLYAQVFVNGKAAGEAANAFVPAVFGVKRLIQAGRNELIVRLTAGNELAVDDTHPGQDKPVGKPTAAADGAIPNPAREGDLYGHRTWFGRKWLRKVAVAYGWDFVDALPNVGIWRGVRLEGRSHAVLHDLRLDTMRQNGAVCLEMEAVIENLHPWSERACALEIEIRPPEGGAVVQRRYSVDLQPGRAPVRDLIEIPDAQLWWPNTMGGQPLYRVSARVTGTADRTCDSREFAIGLRTVEIDCSRLQEGSRFCIRVNGEDVFCRGGNIGPQDAILARVTDAKLERLVAEVKNSHMTMIRINGCSIYEAPAFYDACDRAGILVWQDFPLTCTTYPDDDENFRAAVRAEAKTAVRLLRHHPSIALWCGNNECTWGFRDWWNPDKTRPLDIGGARLYNQVLPDLCRQLDPRRPYRPGSSCGGEAPNSEQDGDCHWWNPFFMNKDVNRRIRHEVLDECRSRFVSEYGIIGPCHLDSIREYLAPEEMHPDHVAWRTHTNSIEKAFEEETIRAAISLHYADSDKLGVEEYVLYGQMFQAIMHGHAMEALRFRKNDPKDDCRGALIWSYTDTWGETGWSILDYYQRRKASYYCLRRACAPVKVIVRQRSEKFVTRIVNDTLEPHSGTADVGWWRLDGSERDVRSYPVSIPSNGMLEVAAAPVPAPEERDPRLWLYAAVLRDGDGAAVDQSVWPLRPCRELTLAAPEISTVQTENDTLEVSSPVFCHGVHVEDHGYEVLSDNWFDLLPGVPIRVRIAAECERGSISLRAVVPQEC